MKGLRMVQGGGLKLGAGDAVSAARAAVPALETHHSECDWEQLRDAAEVQAGLAMVELRTSQGAR
jgi:hypothetical protein